MFIYVWREVAAQKCARLSLIAAARAQWSLGSCTGLERTSGIGRSLAKRLRRKCESHWGHQVDGEWMQRSLVRNEPVELSLFLPALLSESAAIPPIRGLLCENQSALAASSEPGLSTAKSRIIRVSDGLKTSIPGQGAARSTGSVVSVKRRETKAWHLVVTTTAPKSHSRTVVEEKSKIFRRLQLTNH